MKDIFDYLGKVILAIWVLWIVLKLLVALTPSRPSYWGDSNRSNSYRSSGYSNSSYNRTPTPTPRPAVTSSRGSSTRTTSSASRTTSSGRTYSNSSSAHRDVDDYDVDGFYYDNRGDFENEDDAWDYLEDEPDDWD
ncbi:MAG: hypothetical protein IJ600_11990 [Lachnospiraceae bacterium]|nr:hypothetical protein [Lachnospiraceae bacterium]